MEKYMTGIDFLRNMISNFNYCREDFLSQYSVEELVTIRKAWLACEWDIMPDQWSKTQIESVLRDGTVPIFTDDGLPTE
jgi:hypothetical protein